MRPGQNRRMRGRNRKGPNPLTRSFESNGPDVKIRGTAQHIGEKYSQLARDAQASGDPIAAENYLQHAEHYYRIIAAAQSQFQQQSYGGFQRPFEDGQEEGGEGDEEVNGFGYNGPQTAVQEMDAPQPDMRPASGEDTYGKRPPYQNRGERQERPNFDRGDRSDQPRHDQQRQDSRGDRRDRFRRDNNPRFTPPSEEGNGGGLPAFLTNPVRQPISVEGDEGERGFAGPEGNGQEGNGEANGGYPTRSRRRRSRGRGFGGDRPDNDPSSEGGNEPSDNNAPPTPVE